jgi:sulfur relay protein TusB/DsrH
MALEGVGMLVIIKSAPDTPEGQRGVGLARDQAASICLMQNAVYFAQEDRLEGFCGTAYVLQEDCVLRGLGDKMLAKEIKKVDYTGLIDLISKEDKVIGAF